jgi:hypothetical protein
MGICSFALCNYSLTPCELSCYKSEVLSGFFGSGCSDCCCRNGFREFFRDSRAYLRQIFLAVGAKCPHCTHLARPTGRSYSLHTRTFQASLDSGSATSWNRQSCKWFFRKWQWHQCSRKKLEFSMYRIAWRMHCELGCRYVFVSVRSLPSLFAHPSSEKRPLVIIILITCSYFAGLL